MHALNLIPDQGLDKCRLFVLMQFLGSLKPFELREVYTQVQKLKHSESHCVTDTRKVGETAHTARKRRMIGGIHQAGRLEGTLLANPPLLEH